MLYVDFKDNLVPERCLLSAVAWSIISECFTEMTKAMKLYSFPKDATERRRNMSEQSEMEHVKDYKIAENLSK